jgi:hypothetical protein
MLNRHLQDAGLQPWVGYPLFILTFAGLSAYLFQKTPFAPYLYLLIALSFISSRSEKNRNDFLKMCFNTRSYYLTRLAENLLIAFPFALYLSWEMEWIPVILLLSLSGIMVFTAHSIQLNFTLPTPFSKHPYEFATGFRKTILLQLFAFFLTIMAIAAGNFNLGVFSLALLFLVVFSFYTDPEPDFYVWVYNKSTAGFLFGKIGRALLQSSILTLPVLIILLLLMDGDWQILLLFQGMGYLLLFAVILVKYASYPDRMYLPYLILLGMGIYFPPLLLGLIPYLFIKSNQHLKELLG